MIYLNIFLLFLMTSCFTEGESDKYESSQSPTDEPAELEEVKTGAKIVVGQSEFTVLEAFDGKIKSYKLTYNNPIDNPQEVKYQPQPTYDTKTMKEIEWEEVSLKVWGVEQSAKTCLPMIDSLTGELTREWRHIESGFGYYFQGETLFYGAWQPENQLFFAPSYIEDEENKRWLQTYQSEEYFNFIKFSESNIYHETEYNIVCMDEFAVEPWSKAIDCFTLEIDHGWGEKIRYHHYYDKNFREVRKFQSSEKSCGRLRPLTEEECEMTNITSKEKCELGIPEFDKNDYMLCDTDWLNNGICTPYCVNFSDEEDCEPIFHDGLPSTKSSQ